MCFLVLILPFTTCYANHCKERCCCACVDDECYACHFLAKEDMDGLCCCIPKPQRYDMCDVDKCCCRLPEEEQPTAANPPVQIVMNE